MMLDTTGLDQIWMVVTGDPQKMTTNKIGYPHSTNIRVLVTHLLSNMNITGLKELRIFN